MRPFEPLFRNPHILTILSNFWPRRYDWARYEMQDRLFATEPGTQVRVQTQKPHGEAIGELVLVHGLEGGGDAGYVRSMAWHALEAGFVAHRFHMRTCGGTEKLTSTLYHGGLTSDLRSFLEQLQTKDPVFLMGFSLGGNVVLKLAGELGENRLIQGVCAVSVPIDLGACARRIAERDNALYQRRFVSRMKQRLISTGRYLGRDFEGIESIYEIDDRITAPSFGFRDAEHYYQTQSSRNFLDRIRVPALLIQAKDDTFIPFSIFEQEAAFATNPCLRLIATEHGGHLGFLAKSGQRFWFADVVVEWLTETVHATITIDGQR